MIPVGAREGDPLRQSVVFSSIVAITLWFIWKTKCSLILGTPPLFAEDILLGIWLVTIYSLCH